MWRPSDAPRPTTAPATIVPDPDWVPAMMELIRTGWMPEEIPPLADMRDAYPRYAKREMFTDLQYNYLVFHRQLWRHVVRQRVEEGWLTLGAN